MVIFVGLLIWTIGIWILFFIVGLHDKMHLKSFSEVFDDYTESSLFIITWPISVPLILTVFFFLWPYYVGEYFRK